MNQPESAIQTYLAVLHHSLRGINASERNEIVSEIRAHLHDSMQQAGMSADAVLARLGPPAELAAQYRENSLLERASNTHTPWEMLGTTMHLAKISAVGFLCFVLAVLGYGSGAAMMLSALIKPIFPAQTGLWVGPGVFNFGYHPLNASGDPAGGIGLFMLTRGGASVHELLGWWYIPVALLLGAFLIWSTTKILKTVVRKARAERTDFIPARSLAPAAFV